MTRVSLVIGGILLLSNWTATIRSQVPTPVDQSVIKVLPAVQLADTTPGWPLSEWGIVTALSDKAITIKKPGWWGPKYVTPPGGGVVRDIGPVFNPPEPARSFEYSDVLQSGKYLPNQGSYSYLVKDVKVGDKVYLRFSRKAGRETCEAIQIMARLGGLVPPLPEKAEDDPRYRYHDYANAHNDLRDKGIPLPKKLVDAIGVMPTPARTPDQTKPKE